MMSTNNKAILNSNRGTWEIVGLKFPNFWGKGRANCFGMGDAFFPDGERGARAQEVVMTQFCNGCPYKIECLQFALENDEWGVWGGTTREQRLQMKKR